MAIPAAVKEGQPVYTWCDQYKRPVAKKSGEAWTAGQVVVNNVTNGEYEKTSAQKQKGIKAIVAQDAASADTMGLVYFAPAVVYSKYLEAAALKNFVTVQASATAGGWELKTADGTYGTDIAEIAFAQVMGKAGQNMGGLVKDLTDVAQNEIVKLRLL